MLLQQNTDSLESRDDELRDSFETAASSMSRQHSLASGTCEPPPELLPSPVLPQEPPSAVPAPAHVTQTSVPVPASTVTTTASYAAMPSTTLQSQPRAQLRSQETIESYNEEDLLDYARDSPVSVLDKYEPEPRRPELNR